MRLSAVSFGRRKEGFCLIRLPKLLVRTGLVGLVFARHLLGAVEGRCVDISAAVESMLLRVCAEVSR